jgi:chromosome segregation ATPase
MSTDHLTQGRRADSARRRQRVIKALNQAVAGAGELSVSAIARAAGVDRTFLYRHRDLLAQDRAVRQAARQPVRIRQLEAKLAELLGERAWAESGLGGPDDIQQLQRRITTLEQQVADLTGQLEERQQELEAARAADRELITRLNTTPRRHSSALGAPP